MRKWKPAKLGDFAGVLLGKMLDKEKNKGEPHPYLSNKDVRWGKFNTKDLNLMRFEADEHERFGLRYGDLVVCEGGEPGRCAIWRDEQPDMKIQKALHRVRVGPGYSNEFLYYRMLLAGRNGELEKYLIGSTIKHLTGVNLKQVEFAYPEYDEQKRIASVLSALDAKITLNERINAELEAMVKLLYDYWFVQFDFPLSAAQAKRLGKPKLEGKPYKSSGGPMVHNAELKREVPEGWEVGELSDIARITMGQSPPGSSYNETGEGNIFFQGSTDFGARFPITRMYTTQPTRRAKAHDILLSVRAPVGTMNVAYEDCAIGRGLAALNSKDGAIAYLYEVMKYFEQVFQRRDKAGTTFGAIGKDDLFGLKVVLAEKEVIKAFEVFARPMFDQQRVLEAQNRELASLRDWLLPLLMNGQVRVAEAEEKVGLAMAAEGAAKYIKGGKSS